MICDTLIQFAAHREKAFRFSGTFTGTRAQAVTEVKRIAQFWKGKNERVAVKQAEQAIRQLLPHPQSRMKSQREKILTLLTTYL
jgi:hypothetical protein